MNTFSRRQFCKASLLLASSSLLPLVRAQSASLSNTKALPFAKASKPQPYLGEHLWGNRLQDWRVVGDRIECLNGQKTWENRTAAILSHQLSNHTGSARLTCRLGTLEKNKQGVYANEDRARDMIVGAQQHPFWPEGTLTNGGQWALSQTDSAQEPFGTATGHYMSQFIAKFFDQSPNDGIRDGQSKPRFIEVMNEPLYDLTTDRDGANKVEPSKVFDFHNTVANEIRKEHSDVLIGGYTTAFPDFGPG